MMYIILGVAIGVLAWCYTTTRQELNELQKTVEDIEESCELNASQCFDNQRQISRLNTVVFKGEEQEENECEI